MRCWLRTPPAHLRRTLPLPCYDQHHLFGLITFITPVVTQATFAFWRLRWRHTACGWVRPTVYYRVAVACHIWFNTAPLVRTATRLARQPPLFWFTVAVSGTYRFTPRTSPATVTLPSTHRARAFGLFAFHTAQHCSAHLLWRLPRVWLLLPLRHALYRTLPHRAPYRRYATHTLPAYYLPTRFYRLGSAARTWTFRNTGSLRRLVAHTFTPRCWRRFSPCIFSAYPTAFARFGSPLYA